MNSDTKDNPFASASVASGTDAEQASAKSPIISDEAAAMSIAQAHGVDFIKLSEVELSPEIVWLLPQWLVFQHNVIAVKLEDDTLYVAMTNPVDLPTREQINLATGFNVKPIVAAEKDILQAINHHYSAELVTKQDMVDARFGTEQVDKDVGDLEDLVLSSEGGQVARIISCTIKDAIDSGASDIHFEPAGNDMFVRFRVDGILHDCLTVPTAMRNEVTSRLKFLAKLDITEKRRAQDGHINLKYKQNDYDLRVSVVPTIDGEKTVVRVLDKSRLSIELGSLGIGAEEQALAESAVTRPHGMVLVTGPTGCGKTTTLYAMLRNIDAIAKNIITIENPVEYKLKRVSQIQIDPGGSETFAGTLRSILRQDPDVIMVGEIRDFETAEIAVQAALTGHLVLSTLHTEDAVTAITRLRELGIQPFLIASCVVMAIAQRLVRKICPDCKEQHQPDEKILKLLGIEESPPAGFFHGKGCSSCFNTGFHGREGVYEILKIDSDIQSAILQDSNASEIKETAARNGMKTLLDSALVKVFEGKTSVEEVKRVIPRQGF
jgi:type IV pilus assembly protein PilB